MRDDNLCTTMDRVVPDKDDPDEKGRRMSVFHKTMVWLGLVDDDENFGDEDEYYAEEYAEAGVPARASRSAGGGTATATVTAPPATDTSPLTVIRSRRERAEPAPAPTPRAPAVKPIPMPATRVHVMEPRGFNDAQEVGDRLKSGQPVILNLQGVERDLQRRLIDFASGLAYALNGTMAKAADQVFLLTPSNVEVSDEEKERLQARGLYRSSIS
jgi:cell division inhibitor SepF